MNNDPMSPLNSRTLQQIKDMLGLPPNVLRFTLHADVDTYECWVDVTYQPVESNFTGYVTKRFELTEIPNDQVR